MEEDRRPMPWTSVASKRGVERLAAFTPVSQSIQFS